VLLGGSHQFNGVLQVGIATFHKQHDVAFREVDAVLNRGEIKRSLSRVERCRTYIRDQIRVLEAKAQLDLTDHLGSLVGL
jgi:hypothetical protein